MSKPIDEIWKDVPGYEDLYQVSNLGRVRSLYKRGGGCLVKAKGGVLKQGLYKGYRYIKLRKGNHYKQFQAHRLVAMAFIPNPEGLPCVNHKDENRQNNMASNLEWCTYKYNINYGSCIQKIREKRSIPVVQMTADGEIVANYKSMHEAASVTGLQISKIFNVCKGKRNHTGGYKWEYA